MRVNFNSMRKNASYAMNDLQDILHTVISKESYQNIDNDLKEDIIKAFNKAAHSVTVFNWLRDDSIDGDFDELDIDINTLKALEDV